MVAWWEGRKGGGVVVGVVHVTLLESNPDILVLLQISHTLNITDNSYTVT